jgi:hypothetical protein
MTEGAQLRLLFLRASPGDPRALRSASVLQAERHPTCSQDNVPDGGVGGRYRTEPVDFLDLVIERAAHDQPHHHLNALGAGHAQ